MKLNKHQLILRDIACEYIPRYSNSWPIIQDHWRDFNVEHLVEQAMCLVGGYEFVDAHHYDCSDYSDSKTASINTHDRFATVGSILSRDGQEPKWGDLRVVLYNPYYDRLDYYFMPKAGWESIREYGAANRNKLRAKYNPELDIVYKWNQWRVPDFKTLARMPSTVTDPQEYKTAQTHFTQLFELA